MVPIMMDSPYNQRNVYWKREEPRSKWQIIPATKTALKEAISQGARFTTVAQFTLDGNGNPDRYFAPLYVDFDGNSINEAIDDAIAFIHYLELEFGYPVKALRIFLTGGRGVHIEVPAVTFGAEEGDPNLVYIYKTIVDSLPYKTLDRLIYNQKKGRMWRLPNLQRSNGRFKVPVCVQKLMNTPHEELWQLTENPRFDFQYPAVEKFPVCKDLQHEFEWKRQQFYENNGTLTSGPIDDAVIKKFFHDELPVCIRTILNSSGLSGSDCTNFNQIALTLARCYTNAGLSESCLLEDAEGFCEDNFPDSNHYPDLDTKIRHMQELHRFVASHANEYSFNCGYIKKLRNEDVFNFSCDSCPIEKLTWERQKTVARKTAKPFVLENGLALYERKVTHMEALVEEVIGANKKICLAGPTNVGKSIISHQIGISLATGEKSFLGFKIPRPRVVLYLNFEMSDEQFHGRHQLLCSELSRSRIELLQNFHHNTFQSDRALFQDNWKRIRATVEANAPFDLIIVDNIYACTGVDDESNRELKGLLRTVFSVADLHGSSVLLVGHHKKSPPDSPLSISLIRGGSTLANAMDSIIQMGFSLKERDLRLFKITKNRDRSPNRDKTFGIEFDPAKLWFSNRGLVNEAVHLSYPKPLPAEEVLAMLDDVFTTGEWIKAVQKTCKKSERTAKYWIDHLIQEGLIKTKSFGFYEKINQ